MTKEEAKVKVIDEFRLWRADPENKNEKMNGHKALLFYNQISAAKPELFTFKSSDEKWQVVHGWLRNAGLISD